MRVTCLAFPAAARLVGTASKISASKAADSVALFSIYGFQYPYRFLANKRAFVPTWQPRRVLLEGYQAVQTAEAPCRQLVADQSKFSQDQWLVVNHGLKIVLIQCYKIHSLVGLYS